MVRKHLEIKPTKGFRADVADSQLYEDVQSWAANEFGTGSQAYKTILNGINQENGTGSQVFWNTATNLYLPSPKRVITLDDAEAIHRQDKTFLFNEFYTDTQDVILRTSRPSYKPNTQILKGLVSQVESAGHNFSSNNPLRISGLELVNDDNSQNPYGLQFKLGEKTIIQNDPRFAYGNEEIEFGGQTKRLWTKENGLSGVFLGRGGYVDSGGGGLQDSNDGGRVVSFGEAAPRDFEGELHSLKSEYQEGLRNLIAQAQKELNE